MWYDFVVLTATGPEEVLYSYGPLGVGALALAYIANKFITILLADRTKAIQDRDDMVQDLLTKVFPAIVKNTEVLEARQELDRELIDTIKKSNDLREETKTAFLESRRAFESLQRTIQGGRSSRFGGGE